MFVTYLGAARAGVRLSFRPNSYHAPGRENGDQRVVYGLWRASSKADITGEAALIFAHPVSPVVYLDGGLVGIVVWWLKPLPRGGWQSP